MIETKPEPKPEPRPELTPRVIGNVDNILKTRKLREGLNNLDTQDGVTLAAQVVNGVITEYLFIDAVGNQISPRPVADTCQFCYIKNGKLSCYQIPCPS